MLLMIVPFWTNMLIRTYAWTVILRANGLLNNILMSMGVIDRRSKYCIPGRQRFWA